MLIKNSAIESVISYKEVPPASGYTIYFNNDDTHMPADSIENINQYISENGTNVYMTSDANFYNDLGTEYFMTSKPSKTYNFIKLAAPNADTMELTRDGVLTWSAIANNLGYHVTILKDGVQIVDIDHPSVSFEIEAFELGHTYTVSVYAKGNGTTRIQSATTEKEWQMKA